MPPEVLDPDMEQAIEAYRHVSATDEFKEIERMRSRARHNEAAEPGTLSVFYLRYGVESY